MTTPPWRLARLNPPRPRRSIAAAALIACIGAAPLARAATNGLHVDCRGAPTASPMVILVSGAFGTSADWDLVLDALAKGGRACAWDRAGTGESPPAAAPRDVTAIAAELAALLDSLGETGPVILVGHSNGALYAEAFAATLPARVAGLVYVNGVTSNDLSDPVLLADLARERRLADTAAQAASLGLAPLVAPSVVRAEDLPPAAAHRKIDALSRPRRLKVARDEDRAMIPGLAEVAALGGSPAQIPTVAVISDSPGDLAAHWRAAERVPALRSRAGWILDIPGATHTSPLSRDRAWITAAVDWLRSAGR